MNGSKLVSQVNCELAGILDNELSRIGVIREQPPADVLATRLNSTSGILVPTRRGLRSPDYARLEALLDQIADFWNERITDYLQAVSGLPGLTICSRAPRSDLCCFFDTVIYSDSASGIALLKEERTLSDIMLAVDALNDMKPLLPLMAQGGEPPAIATIPFHPPLFGLQVPDANAADLNFTPLQPEYEKLLVEYLTEHARMDARPASVLEWASKIPIDASRTLDDVLDLDVLRPLVIPEDSTYLSKQRQPRASLQNRDQYPGAQRFEECIAGRSIALDKYGQWTGFRIGWEIGSGLFHVLAHEQVCAAVNSSPYIEHARLYMLFLELTAGRIAKAFQLRNDVAVARSITLPPFHWLGDLSPEEVMRLREAGVYAPLRAAFASQEKRLRDADIDDFQEIAAGAEEQLQGMVTEYRRELELDAEKYRRIVRRTALSFSCTLGLAILSVAAPATLLVTVPATVFAVAIGSASVRDLAGLIIRERERLKHRGARPIGLIAELRQCEA